MVAASSSVSITNRPDRVLIPGRREIQYDYNNWLNRLRNTIKSNPSCPSNLTKGGGSARRDITPQAAGLILNLRNLLLVVRLNINQTLPNHSAKPRTSVPQQSQNPNRECDFSTGVLAQIAEVECSGQDLGVHTSPRLWGIQKQALLVP